MDDLEKFLFADDGIDSNLKKLSVEKMETTLLFMEHLKFSDEGYAQVHQEISDQLKYMERMLAALSKRFAKLPPPNTG